MLNKIKIIVKNKKQYEINFFLLIFLKLKNNNSSISNVANIELALSPVIKIEKYINVNIKNLNF